VSTGEQYVRICGRIGRFTERLTGVSIVDAYFGPPSLAPERQTGSTEPDIILQDIGSLVDNIEGNIRNRLRREYLLGEASSLQAVVRWLSGTGMPYAELVRDLFHVEMKQFPAALIDRQTRYLEELMAEFPGRDLREKVEMFRKQGEVSGEALRTLVEHDLQSRSVDVGDMFQKQVFSLMHSRVTDNGVEYRAVSDKPWGGYNYYKGGFRSVNEFNIDRPANRDSMLLLIYHEYEHHVSNLWREKAYVGKKYTELSIVPLHTGRCIISEGAADTAKEFLNVDQTSPRMKVYDALYALIRMVHINAAIMMNRDGRDSEEVADYISEHGLRTKEMARGMIDFIAPRTRDGRVNLWAPYAFTYHIGRADFVLPTFRKAEEHDSLAEFYRTLYLNPFSGSSVTWSEAFDWL